MKNIIKYFHSEMEKGLRGEPSSLKMIPTYVDRPTGNEKGKFIALDLGGTNFRILELELKGKGKAGTPHIMKFALEKRCIVGTAEDCFGFIAECLKIFLTKYKVGASEERHLGFTFSFAVKQTGVASGTLVCWTKGFETKGVVGKDVVGLLNAALARKNIGNIKIAALANDTVGTLVAKSYEDPHCDVGVILGTGTNACYPEDLSNIIKWDGPPTSSGRMIINTEWGNFDKLKLTAYDKKLDRDSDNPGRQILEKMVSGMYLGEVVRLVLQDLAMRKEIFKKAHAGILNQKGALRAEHVSEIEKDTSAALSKVKSVLDTLGVSGGTLSDLKKVRQVCGIISLRAARISAAAVAAVVTRIDPGLSGRHTIAIDGSVYEKHPGFSGHMKFAINELFGRKASKIRMALAKDGSGKGAAIIAAVVAQD